ncbi:MAG: hypothetical protein CSYNP_00023 [Syntrophus sp. SKADARSKE-3]|nr:hypothetical protein [Syntrophus sp. SKADARSKE-3]
MKKPFIKITYSDKSIHSHSVQRNSYIDAMKGAAIILVVLGHAVQVHDANFDNNYLFRIIYAFHMPFFMFLSGLVLSSQLRSPFINHLKKNFCRLVIPFLVWYLIDYLFILSNGQATDLISYFIALYQSPDRGLWFLWVLFINTSILSIILQIVRVKNWLQWEDYFVVAAIIASRAIPSIEVLGFSEVRYLFLYYAAGYLVYKHIDTVKNFKTLLQFFTVIAFPLLVIFWRRNEPPTFYAPMMQLIQEPYVKLAASIYKYSVAFAGMVFMSFIIDRIRGWRGYACLCWLGTMTFDIYVSHGYFLFGIGHGIPKYISAAGAATFLSLILSFVLLRRFKLLKLLFLGQLSQNK